MLNLLLILNVLTKELQSADENNKINFIDKPLKEMLNIAKSQSSYEKGDKIKYHTI